MTTTQGPRSTGETPGSGEQQQDGAPKGGAPLHIDFGRNGENINLIRDLLVMRDGSPMNLVQAAEYAISETALRLRREMAGTPAPQDPELVAVAELVGVDPGGDVKGGVRAHLAALHEVIRRLGGAQ